MPHDAMPGVLASRLAAAGWVPAGLLGAGAHGPAWAVQRSDGRGGRAVVRDLDATMVVGTDACADRLTALRGLENPHVARVLEVVDDGARGLLVLVEEVPGPTLAAVVDARGALSTGEVVTVVVAVSRALAALHGAGLVHADVAPSNVVVDPSGTPVLIDLWGAICADGDLGTAGFASAAVLGGAPPRPEDDVHALGRLGQWAWGESGCEGIEQVAQQLRAACETEPARRPTAAELGERCRAAARPEPLRLPDPAALARAEVLGSAQTCRAVMPTRRRPAPPGVAAGIVRKVGAVSRAVGTVARNALPRRAVAATRPGRGTHAAHRACASRWASSFRRVALLAVIGTCALAAGALWGGGLVTGGGSEAGSSRQVPVDARVPPTTAGTTADARPSPLVAEASADVVAPVSDPAPEGDLGPTDPAAAARHLTGIRAQLLVGGDSTRLTEIDVPGSAAYETDRAIMVGLAGSVGSVDGLTCAVEAAVVHADATTALVDVTSALSAHTRRGPDGAALATVPATAPRTVRLTLRRTDLGWRVSDVADPA